MGARNRSFFWVSLFVLVMGSMFSGGVGRPGMPVVVVVAVALVVVIAANTVILASNNSQYRWWYGLVKVAFYFGSFVLTMATGGASTAIASVSTFLGMELNRLAQLMHQLGILPKIIHAIGAGNKTEEGKNTAER